MQARLQLRAGAALPERCECTVGMHGSVASAPTWATALETAEALLGSVDDTAWAAAVAVALP